MPASRRVLGALVLVLVQCKGTEDPAGTSGGSATTGTGTASSGTSDATGTTRAGTGDGSESEESQGDPSSSSEASDGSSTSGFVPPAYLLGADISSVQEAAQNGTQYRDTDGQVKPMLELLASHGFNAVRLRVFVDPLAPYGYASDDDCPGRAEAYCDRDHTAAFAAEVKAAGMALLLDFHYSDTWADPGKQVIPEAWRELGSIEALANAVREHTTDVVTALVDAGGRPDLVQIGNEITPGMLIHVPTASTDCYGNGSTPAPVTGSTASWDNLATLLTAGAEAVRDVDDGIRIMLHVENTDDLDGAHWWVSNAIERGVPFDVLGLSCYEAFQGPPETWQNTFESLAAEFPELSFVIAEYNPSRREANDIVHGLPDGRGLGTFFWEPTQSGSWGASMFRQAGGGVLEAIAEDFAVFDEIAADYGL